jgi:erythritol/L-threitol dehydrogenase
MNKIYQNTGNNLWRKNMSDSTNDTMQAIVCHGPHDYRVEQMPKPHAKDDELIISISGCGICAGDIKCEAGADMFWGGEKSWVQPPFVAGHEFYGDIVELGNKMKEKWDLKIGDQITAEQIVPCGKCRFCRSGQYWMCEVHNMYGYQKEIANGGMAEFMKFGPTSIIHKIPRTLTEKEAALIEPMACAIHAVRRATIDLDDVVVISGAGPLGLCMIQVARLKTPKKLIVLDMDNSRLKLAKKLGADICFNPSEGDIEKEIKKLTNGYGCDVYIEASGHPSSVKQGLNMIRRLGRFVEFGVFGKETSQDWSVIGDRKELDIRGSHLGPYCYPIAIDLFERKLVSAEDIVTHEYPLSKGKEAMKMAASLESIKVVVIPDSRFGK